MFNYSVGYWNIFIEKRNYSQKPHNFLNNSCLYGCYRTTNSVHTFMPIDTFSNNLRTEWSYYSP